jgi:hypothetical protein
VSKRRICKIDGCARPTETEELARCRTCRRKGRRTHDSKIQAGGPRILMIDIETAPNLVYTWGLWNQNIGINQIVEPCRMLCFVAKWLGEPEIMFHSELDGRSAMLDAAHDLLDQADVVVHYYGSRFDVPHLYREFLQSGMTPPSPFKQVDLKNAVAKRFKFPSNKLQFISQAIGLSGKEETGGFDLWRGCMAGEAASWKTMRKYNERDVTLLEEVYETLLPWIPNVAHRHLYNATGECPACGADKVKPAGLYRTPLSVFQQYRCDGCGSFFRESKRITGTNIQATVLS